MDSVNLLQAAFLALMAVYIVSAVTILFKRNIPVYARIVVSAICVLFAGLSYFVSTVATTTGGFAVGILAAILSLNDAHKHFWNHKPWLGVFYVALALFYIVALIMHPAFR